MKKKQVRIKSRQRMFEIKCRSIYEFKLTFKIYILRFLKKILP